MKTLSIRTTDAVLERALRLWWNDFSIFCLPGKWTVTDLDSFPRLDLPKEFTVSFGDARADLLRPFSYEALEKLFLSTSERPTREERLVFCGENVFLDGNSLSLTPLEKRLLELLWQAEEPLSKEALSLALWGVEHKSNQINVYINYLRKKTEFPDKKPLIHTLWGKGFYIEHDGRTIYADQEPETH